MQKKLEKSLIRDLNIQAGSIKKNFKWRLVALMSAQTLYELFRVFKCISKIRSAPWTAHIASQSGLTGPVTQKPSASIVSV